MVLGKLGHVAGAGLGLLRLRVAVGGAVQQSSEMSELEFRSLVQLVRLHELSQDLQLISSIPPV